MPPWVTRGTRHSISEVPIILLRASHVKAQAHTIKLLAQVAHSLQRAVTTHGSHSLQHLQQVLALKRESQALGSAGDIHVGAEEHRLHLDGGILWIISVGAAQGYALDIGCELMILSELELRVLAADAQRVVNGQQLLLASLGSHGTTCLGQQILAGERTSSWV